MKTNDVQIVIEKGKGEKKKIKDKSKSARLKQRKKTARKGNTHTSGSQGALRGCSVETK